MNETRKEIYPTNDWMFKRIYGRKGNEKITEKFIEAFLGLEVKIEELEEQKNLETEIFTEKGGVIDVLVQTKDGTQINLEMQVGNYDFIDLRLTRYACKLFGSGLERGKNYDATKRTIAVMFLKNNLDTLKKYPKHTFKWKFREETYAELVLTDELEIVIISLEKIKEMIEKGEISEKEKIALWTQFLLNPNNLKGEDMEENEEIKEATDVYNEVTTNMQEINAAIRREEFLHDIATLKSRGLKEGLEQR